MSDDFLYSQLYQPGILAGLIAHTRRKQPEWTETDEADPVASIHSASAAGLHSLAAILDLVAAGNFPNTMLSQAHARALGASYGYTLRRETPATAVVVADLQKALAALTTLAYGPTTEGSGALFGTVGTEDSPASTYEYVGANVDAQPPSALQVVSDRAGVLTTEAGSFAAFSATPLVNDAIYIGHPELMLNAIAATITAPASGVSLSVEYYDETSTAEPDSVTDNGDGTLTFDLTGYLGSVNRAGLLVTATLRSTLAEADATVVLSGGVNKITTSYLGQSSPSTNAADYAISTNWVPVPSLTDGTIGLSQSGTISFALPWDTDRGWRSTTINALVGFWLRVRVAAVSGPSAPTISLAAATNATWSILLDVVQGQRVIDNLGTITNETGQKLYFANRDYIQGSVVQMAVGDDATWQAVDSLADYGELDKVYQIGEDPDGQIWVQFGDGTFGRKPIAGSAVVAIYRRDAVNPGNAGAGEITENLGGAPLLANTRNPRDATGWTEAEGSTPESLERLRKSLPALVRTKKEACSSGDDYEFHATSVYVDDSGASPVARAQATAYPSIGTEQLVVVGKGGGQLSTAALASLQQWFNGQQINGQRRGGVSTDGVTVVCVNYVQKSIDVTATVTVGPNQYPTAKSVIEQALRELLDPLAVQKVEIDGVLTPTGVYLHQIGGVLRDFQVVNAISRATIVQDLTISLPAAPVAFGTNGLPVAGSINITVVKGT